MGVLSKVPGFRSGNKFKSAVAALGYTTVGLATIGALNSSPDTIPPQNNSSTPTITAIPTSEQITDYPNITPTTIPTPLPTEVPPAPTTRPTNVPTRPPIPTDTPITPRPTSVPTIPSNTQFSCAIEKTCPQMVSCAEAYYHLNVCGYIKRDADKDGVPCEDICPGG